MVKILSAVCGLIGVFWLAFLGGLAVYWWDRRAENVPPTIELKFPIHFLWVKAEIPLPKISFPASLKAERDANAVVYKTALALSEQKAKANEIAYSTINDKYQKSQTLAQTGIKTRTITLIKEIHDVIPPAVDRSFPLPVGLVREHNAAAQGCASVSCVSLASGQSDDSSSVVKASELGSIISQNYGSCLSDKETLKELQSWVVDTVKQSMK